MGKLVKTLLHITSSHTLSLEERPAPSADPADAKDLHVLEVHATSFTSGELLWPEVNEQTHPVPGFDVAGTILHAPGASRFKAGDQVYGYTSVERPGGAREQQVALESELALKPECLPWPDAATVPLSALTAWQALFIHAGLAAPSDIPRTQNKAAERPPRVLVTAASGGVGVWAVQLAHLAGAYVVATCGPRNVQFVERLGADQVLDYTSTPVEAWVAEAAERAFDVVIDCKGGATLSAAWTCLRAGGFMNSVAQPADDLKPATGVAEAVRSKWFIVEPNGAQLALISMLIEKRACQAVVDSVWPFSNFSEAFTRLDSGHARGKVVLQIKE